MASNGSYKARDRALHVDGPAPIKCAIENDALKGIRVPRRKVARRHHIRVPREAEIRTFTTKPRIEIFHVRRARLGELHAMTRKTKGLE